MHKKSYENELGTTFIALGLISCGLLFLMGQVFSLGMLWPFFIILPGIPFLYFAFNGDENSSWLAIPGALITGTGLLLLYQSVTGHWASWAYAWTLYGVFLGGALMYAGERNHDKNVYQVGYGFVVVAGITFLFLGTFFELLIFDGFLRKFLLAAILIGVGVWLLMRDEEFSPPAALSKAKSKRKRRVRINGGHYAIHDQMAQDVDLAMGRNGGSDAT